MNRFFLFLLWCLPLQAYTLQQNYTYTNTTVYSTDLFPDIQKKFEIIKIPDDKTQYRIHAQIIAKTFELNGVPIDTENVRYVNFT